jgi:NtrC-family two-component system response regulator AlgB
LLKRKVNGLKLQLEESISNGEMVTNNSEMQKIIKNSSEIASSNIPILIEGESGTGKEILARYIHQLSNRKENPFIPINCAAIPENLFESELFGHVKGSFTNAIKDRAGRLELANFGTVFLDEVSEIPKQMQVKLLRFLQHNEFERIGESITRRIDVRIICATNRDVDEVLKTGDLRDDFYYRISTVRFKLPPLRERKEDIPLLIDFFIAKNTTGIKYEVSKETFNFLNNYDWPGNIRELENVVKRLIVFAKDGIIKPDYLPIEIINFKPKQVLTNIPRIDELEKQHIQEVLSIAKNLKEASRILGISETTLWRKKKQFGI